MSNRETKSSGDGRKRMATLEGKVRDTRRGKVLGFKDVDAPKGLRGPTDAEHIARHAMREACGTVNPDHYESGEVAAKIIIWDDESTEIRYFASELVETPEHKDVSGDS